MDDARNRLLPPRPASPPSTSAASTSPYRRHLFLQGGVDFLGLKKRGQGARAWIRVDAVGNAQTLEIDKSTMMRRCDLPARDLRLLDPLFVYPSTILGREKAIVLNLEMIRCIITAEEIFLLDSLDGYAMQYVSDLQRHLRMAQGEAPAGSRSPDYLPFEFRALEMALEAACSFLDSQVRDEIEQLMDDNGDMAELCLSEKKKQLESSSFLGDQSVAAFSSNGSFVQSISAPVSPVSSPPESDRRLEKSYSRSRHESIRSSDSTTRNIEELEMLLEAYFVVIDNTLNKLTSLKEYIDDTEDLINIQLDNVRNQLIQFELLLTTATFVVAIFGVVAGIFGMNFPIPFFEEPSGFQWVVVVTGICGVLVFCLFLLFFKFRRLIPL